MVYVGFGFLMVFLKKHCWTSVGFNFVIAAWSMQLAILLTGFWHMALVEEEFHKIVLDIPSLIVGDFGAATVLITFGALLGKCDLPQLFVLATLEVIFFKPKLASTSPASDDNAGGYLSSTIAMVGTLFLYMFWPSFNCALATETQQQRVIISTILAISASCLSAAAICRVKFGKLEMSVILNATLAGGVAIGSSSDLIVTPGIAMAIGVLAGIISTLGFLYLKGWLEEKINM